MEKTILLLTKSSKKSPRTEAMDKRGYCVAGIDLLSGEWVRLVAQYGDNRDESLIEEDLLDEYAEIAEPLDVIRVSVKDYVPIGCQVENWLMDTDEYIDILGRASLKGVFSLCNADFPEYVYGDSAEYLTEDELDDVEGSLILIPAENISIYDTGRGYQRRTKMSFNYDGEEYKDFSMTDPEYYGHQGETIDYAFLVVSLPNSPLNSGRYYKFVAKILEVTEDEYEAFFPEKPEPDLPEIDYDEYMTVREAYDRYADRLSPLIIVSDEWNNDYCFAITGLTDLSASGETFVGGHHRSHRYVPQNWSVRIYNGPSVNEIKEYMNSHENE